jgi:uncharacterized protein (DUF1778 family)
MAVAKRSTQLSDKTERFEARLTPDQKQVLTRAAAHQGQTLSQFVLSSAQREAERVIRESEVIRLSVRDFQTLLEALRDPGPPSAKLVEGAQRYREFMGEA